VHHGTEVGDGDLRELWLAFCSRWQDQFSSEAHVDLLRSNVFNGGCGKGTVQGCLRFAAFFIADRTQDKKCLPN